MLTLIFSVVFGILIATFAVQNRNLVDLRFGSYLISGVPVYLVVLLAILLTLVFTGILYLIHSVSSSFTLFGKDNAIRREHQEREKLAQQVHALEEENQRLKHRQTADPTAGRSVFSR